jgi:hypothetical protein
MDLEKARDFAAEYAELEERVANIKAEVLLEGDLRPNFEALGERIARLPLHDESRHERRHGKNAFVDRYYVFEFPHSDDEERLSLRLQTGHEINADNSEALYYVNADWTGGEWSDHESVWSSSLDDSSPDVHDFYKNKLSLIYESVAAAESIPVTI